MGIMLLLQAERSVVLWVALLIAVALTVWEVWEQRLSRRLSLWWVLLVLLTHVPGYLGLRGWVAYRARSAGTE